MVLGRRDPCGLHTGLDRRRRYDVDSSSLDRAKARSDHARRRREPTASEGVGAPPEDSVVEIVLAASRLFVAVASRALVSLDTEVTLPQLRILALLAERNTMSVAGLAEAVEVTPSTISRMCDRLLRKHLIQRRSSRTDRRQLQIRLSDAGRALVCASTEARRAEITRLLARLCPEDASHLLQGLAALVEASSDISRTTGAISAEGHLANLAGSDLELRTR
jgi:DNA-binding MarR family transcriptional regulator